MADTTLSPEERLAAATDDAISELHATNPLRDGLSPSAPQRFKVERPKSSFAAWYQFFPRSEGATFDTETGKIKQGTLVTALSGLERAKAEGFDIVYLPPIFPIGVTNRKGRNNALVAGPDDPGSRSASVRRWAVMTPWIRCWEPWMISRRSAPVRMSSA